MKKTILVSFIIAVGLLANAQVQEPIIAGNKITFYSTSLKENRKLWIYTPAGTSLLPDADKKYPVLYLLDGDAHFLSTTGIIQQLSQANGNAVLPEMIIVGIENTDRLRDLTPVLDTPGLSNTRHPFLQFLSKELIPYINSHYPVAPYQILAGHSLGGLTAIDILSNSPELFNAYIAIDPSLWYRDEKYLNNALTKLPHQNLKGKRLFISIANTLPPSVSFASVTKDRSAQTQHIRSILKLDRFLSTRPVSGLKYASHYFADDNHNSVPLISEYEGLRFVFDYYRMNATESDFADSSARIVSMIQSHYDTITREMGYTVAPSEPVIHYFAYSALANHQFNKAKAFLQMNIRNYPGKASVYDAYADYAVAIKDTVAAVVHYKKALSLADDSLTRSKLDQLLTPLVFSMNEEELKKFSGRYILEAYKIPVLLEIRKGHLFAIVQGQPEDELIPIAKDRFTVKGKQGYVISFQMNNERAAGFTSVQPNGVFKAVLE